MLQKMHHTITDGEGGVRLSVQFIDLERHPSPTPATEADRSPEGGPTPAASPSRCSPPTTLAHNLRRQAGMARRAGPASPGR